MPVDWSPLVARLQQANKVLMVSHVRPDGDALGSMLALADALRGMGKEPRVVSPSAVPGRYAFLDPKRTAVEEFVPPGDGFRGADLVFVVDTGTWNQLADFGPFLRTLDVPKAVIDHHRTQDDLGGERFVDVSAEATGRLVYDLIRATGAEPSAAAAGHLFMAVATDTGWFRHPNTTAATFELAAELVRLGADPSPLYEHLYEAAPAGRLKLLGKVLDRLAVRAGGRVAYAEVHLADFAAAGAAPGDGDGLIDYPRGVAGVEVAAVFAELSGGRTKVSLRARTADVSKVAEKFGGGGHRLAAGATVELPLAAARDAVLAAVDAALADPA